MSRAKKKSYRELKADPVIKAPLAAWVLDRKALYISVTLVGCLAAGAFVYQGWEAYGAITAPVEKDTPYLTVDPAESAGARWATSVLNGGNGIEGWELRGLTQPSHGFLQDATGGTAGEVPITLLATQLASAGEVKALAQVYGAGQARKQYDLYVSKLSAQGPVESKQISDSGVFGARFERGFILLAGDAIVGVQTLDDAQREELLAEYLSEVESTLPESGCVNISAADGSKRSLYFDAKSFEGLQETREVDPEVNTDYLPTLQALGTNEIADPYASTPEAPLPESLPALPPEVKKPTLQNAPPAIDDFTEIASYRVQDPIGPGCGWDWSAQNPLEDDVESLRATEADTVTKLQNDVNGKAQSYVDSQISWARIVALTTPKLDSWNNYVGTVNAIHDRWAKLTRDREALRPLWDTYLANYESWSTFDARKAAAQQSYDASLAQCIVTRETHDEWELEWGSGPLREKQDAWREEQEALIPEPSASPSPNPTATPSPQPTAQVPTTPMPTAPPEPADCAFDPAEPLILDQQKPAEPAAPAIPEDVTIPNSWPKP